MFILFCVEKQEEGRKNKTAIYFEAMYKIIAADDFKWEDYSDLNSYYDMNRGLIREIKGEGVNAWAG